MPYFVSIDTVWQKRNYEPCRVARKLRNDEVPEGETMYQIIFDDDLCIDCFDDELWEDGKKWKE